jgi:starch synthase
VKVLHVASEVAPFAKTGGLADVLGALPKELEKLGIEVEVVMPRYRSVSVDGMKRRAVATTFGEVGVYQKGHVFFVDHPPFFDRAGLYGEDGKDYPDNAHRFALLGQAALAVCPEPDVLHGHDWQAGPALIYGRHLKKVFTIHNLAYQGLFPSSVVSELQFPVELYEAEGFEYWGQVSLLKAGIVLADRITTVSPRYAEEVQTSDHGFGLDGVLRARKDRLVGILNGCDYDVWNPQTDRHLVARYSAQNLEGKKRCKAELQRELGLPQKPRTPFCGSISRLAEQKGFDLLVEALPALLEGDMQYVVLGTGEPELERALEALGRVFPEQLAVRIAYDDALAHRIEAGCDLYVMPSRYEPCGLNQMYSLRYGTPPIVRATGGLDDTIVDFSSPAGTGFKFGPYSAAALGEAWRRALLAYFSEAEFTALIRRAMAQDFSWQSAAQSYASLYRQLAFSETPE